MIVATKIKFCYNGTPSVCSLFTSTNRNNVNKILKQVSLFTYSSFTSITFYFFSFKRISVSSAYCCPVAVLPISAWILQCSTLSISVPPVLSVNHLWSWSLYFENPSLQRWRGCFQFWNSQKPFFLSSVAIFMPYTFTKSAFLEYT